MKVFTKGEIISCTNKSFVDQKGVAVEYNENYIRDSEGEVVKVNSKHDFSSYVGVPAALTITFRPDPTKPQLYKPSLSAVEPLPVEQR